MPPDKDQPWTWVKYREGLCEGCRGDCCTMPVEVKVEDLVRLGVCSLDEIENAPKKTLKRLQKEGVVATFREGTGLYQLERRPNGDCLYLHPQTRLCKVYEKRPGVCREFPQVGPRPGYCPKNPRS